MQPTDALAYLVQIAADYTNGLPPSARGPTQSYAQQAIDCLAQFTNPPTLAEANEPDNVSTLPPPRKPRA